MEFLKLECPNCHAQLSIENGLDTFFCQYCGSKIILSGQNPAIVRAKVEMHKTDTEAELERVKLQHEFEVMKYKKEQERSENRAIFFWGTGLFLLLFALLYFLQ